jgi:predicted  nucleic acid-binding Zn-ribbon protein
MSTVSVEPDASDASMNALRDEIAGHEEYIVWANHRMDLVLNEREELKEECTSLKAQLKRLTARFKTMQQMCTSANISLDAHKRGCDKNTTEGQSKLEVNRPPRARASRS